MSFLQELKKRNVLRVGAAYIVTAWLVIQVVETIFPAFGFGDAAIRYVTIAAAIGFVPVLVLAWVFELTPEGLKRDSEVDHERSAAIENTKRLDRIILVVLVLALGYFAFDKFMLDPARDVEMAEAAREAGRTEALVESYGDQSIAVLAFENMSADKDQEYFADGISEEILNLLARIPELRVISRSSAFTYKGKEVPVPQIARELKVAHVLEGSVRKAGNQIRVTAQLIEGRSDTHLWSQTWDRTLEDIFSIQDEIAADVVDELHVRLTGTLPTSRRTDPEVYALTLQAKQEMEFMAEGYLDRVNRLLDRALDLDPEYVPALEARVLADFMLSDETYTQDELDRRYQQWRTRILAVDPRNGVIQGYDAWELYMNERDIEGAASTLQQLLKDYPNNTEILRTAAAMLRRVGRYGPGLQLAQQCVRLDPLRVSCLYLVKEMYLWDGQLDLAYEYMQRIRVLWNEPARTRDVLLLILLDDGQGALDMLDSWGDGLQATAYRALAAFVIGDLERYEMELARFLAGEHSERNQAYFLGVGASLFAFTGDLDEAFRWLDRLAEADENQAALELFSPEFQPMREDPRWDEFRDQIGMGAERLDALEFVVPDHIPPVEERLGLD